MSSQVKRRRLRTGPGSRFAAAVASFAVVFATLSAPTAVAAPVIPDPPPQSVTALASLSKTASATQVVPGQTFTYTLTVGCSAITDVGCRGAVLTDVVPSPFVVVGAVVGAGQNTAAQPVIAGNSVTVTWSTPLGDGTVGILDATTAIVEITAQLPADASYDVNGIPVVNDAVIEGVNFADQQDQVSVTPLVPLALQTTAAKSFAPTEAVATPGTPVVATLGGTNTSNATVDALSIQDPVDPGTTPDPFDSLAFTGFGAITAPAGADPALTTYEVFAGGIWQAAPGGALPGGVAAADVKGTRVTFRGAIPAGASGSVALNLAVTDAAAAADDGTPVVNDVQSVVDLAGTIATGADDATFTLRQNTVTVGASKSFAPTLVIAGEQSTVTIGGRNTSTIPIDSLTITEPATGTFSPAYTFEGFSGGISWPGGATSAAVVYRFDGGETPSIPFANGATPALPGPLPGTVTSFRIVFMGDIVPGGETSIPFMVETDPDATPLPQGVTNVVGVVGENAGVVGSADAAADLYIYDERLEPYISKQIRPTPILAVPGQVTTVTLNGGLTERPSPPETESGTTGRAEQIVIQDPDDPISGDPWWNAFDITAIAQTPVPADSTLTVEYYDTESGSWETLSGPIAGPTIYSQQVPADISEVAGGVRFVFDYTGTDGGFAPGTDLSPSFTSSLRADGRYIPGPPFSTETVTSIPNCAQTDASSPTPGVPDGQAVLPPAECPVIELIPPDPGNVDLIDKSFGTSSSGGPKSVIARSGDTIPSTLNWSTGGYSNLQRVEITDVASPETTALAASVYNSFDLFRIDPITPAIDPLIAFDAVQSVQLYNGTAWVTATNNPCAALCVGQFPGMSLTGAERASTQGVRLVVIESPSRAAASAGNPAAPPVGSGVARSFANDRPLTLVWQVRDTRRAEGTPVLGDELYNLTANGVVHNTANATGFPADGGPSLSADAADDVIIIDVPITTTTDKNWLDGPISVPLANSGIEPTAYPISRIVITTRNTTPAKVDQLWITDPAPGSPSTVFDTQQFGGFLRIDNPAGADPGQTFVDLYFADGSVVTYDRAGALALTEATVPGGRGQIVGFQARFEGRINAGASAVIELRLRLKPINSATGEPTSTADSPATNVAQGIAADIDPPGTCPPPAGTGPAPRYACDEGAATLTLADPSFEISVSKSFSPAEQKEPDNAPIVMNLTTQPSGATRAVTIIVGDGDAAFWNAFDLVGLDPSFTLTSPIARVQACYIAGGTFAVEGDDVVVTGGGDNECSPSGGTLAEAIAHMNAAPRDVHQITFQFWSENGLGWTNPANPVQTVPVLVQRRAELRTGGPVPTTRSDQTAAPGQPAAGLFDNDISAIGLSAQIAPGIPIIRQEGATAQYRFLHRQNSVSVTKTPNGDVRPGVAIPYTLRFANTGERPITDPVFSDELPMDVDGPQLVFDPDRDPSVSPYSFALSGPTPTMGTPVPTNPDELTIDEQADRIVFTPPPGTVLGIGQTYSITIQLMLRPGLPAGTRVVNTATITGGEPFDDCITTPAGQVTPTCSDDATVSPMSVPALSTIKYVKADTPVAAPGVPDVLSVANGYSCEGTATADGFYRAPCVPVTRPGDTETWRFVVTNAGTLPLDRVVSIDNLPIPGDQGLIATVPRGSEWTPTLIGGVELVNGPTTPAGAALTTFYSTSSVPCIADLNPLGTPCAAGAWLPLDDTVDPSLVRSIKYVVDFPADDLMQPGDTLDLRFQTRTTPASRTATDFPIAYNTVSTGGSAVGAQRIVVPATEGRRVGVSHPTGSIRLQKEVEGPASDLAPDEFPVQLVCTVAGQSITPLPVVVLIPGDDPVEVDGLPLGAECTATERQYGQTTTTIGTAIVGGPQDPIGLVTVENYYDVSDLTIVKTVDAAGLDSRGDPVEYGPFAFRVECTFGTVPVWATGYSEANPMAAELTTEERWALAGLPVGSRCTVTEEDDLGAASTTMTVTAGDSAPTTVPDTSVDVTVVEGAAVAVEAVNTFGAGSLALEKVVTGPGADDFGAGPFLLAISCTLDTGSGPARVWAGFVPLGGDDPLAATIDDIATGASCVVTEVVTAGATDVSISPSPVIIGDGTTVEVTVTNTFEAGSLTVTKVIDGDGAGLWGAGPFEVTLECVRTFGGAVDIPGGATRVLDADNGYTATYDPLLVGLSCTLTETDAGGAASTTITDTDGVDVEQIDIPQGEVEVIVTNTFDVGSLTVSKTLSGGAASAHADDTFDVATSCVWNGASIEVPGGAERTLSTTAPAVYADLPVGAECTVVETDARGADAVVYSPAAATGPGAVVVVGAGAAASVTIDNRFDPVPPPLPNTGFDAVRVGALTALGLLLLALGLAVIRRRREA